MSREFLGNQYWPAVEPRATALADIKVERSHRLFSFSVELLLMIEKVLNFLIYNNI